MVNDVIHSFLEYSDDVKDEAWAAEKCRVIMMNAIQVTTKEQHDKGLAILYGRFPDVDLNKLFANKVMKGYKDRLSDSSVYLFESVRNAMIDDRIEADLRCWVNSLDPLKEEKRQSDKELLRNRQGIEGLLNEITGSNGMPPQRVKGKDFHGNVDDFDQQGGDDMDPDSIDTWFESKWGLLQEINLQKAIDAILRTNQITRNYDKYINDILISLQVWSQCYVDDRNGAIKVEHILPYQVYVLNATGSNDYKDMQAVRLPKQTNVRGFLREFGNYFDMANDWNLLLGATGGGNGGVVDNRWGVSGITENGQLLYGSYGKTIDFKAVLDAPVEYEYAEWKTVCRLRKQWVVTAFGNLMPQTIDKDTPQQDGISVEEKTYEETYRAWYLRSGSGFLTPKLIRWGKVYMQEVEGFEDEYSGYTVKGMKRDGAPMTEILRPFWQLMNVSFKMFEMLVNDIKPDGWWINYTSLMKIAAFLQSIKDTPDDVRSAVDDYMKLIQESPNALSDNPQTDEGDPMGGGNMAVLPKKNGLNQAAIELMKIMDWIELKVQKYTSTEGIVPTGTENGYKLSLENKKRARQATTFIDFILLSHLEDISITLLNYTKDISKFKTTPAYKYLEAQVGFKCMDFIASMKKAPHRYGTYIDTFNNDIELLEMKQLAMAEYQKGTLPFEDVLAVRSCDSVKQALAYLATARRKALKQKRLSDMGLLKQQDANAEAAHQRLIQLENLKGEWLQKARKEEALGFSNAAAVNAKARITTVQLQQEGANERLASEAVNDIDKMTAEFNQDQQKPAK